MIHESLFAEQVVFGEKTLFRVLRYLPTSKNGKQRRKSRFQDVATVPFPSVKKSTTVGPTGYLYGKNHLSRPGRLCGDGRRGQALDHPVSCPAAAWRVRWRGFSRRQSSECAKCSRCANVEVVRGSWLSGRETRRNRCCYPCPSHFFVVTFL